MINQTELDLPNQNILTRSSKLRSIMRQSRDKGESIIKRAQKAKGQLFLIVMELRKQPGAMRLVARNPEFIKAWTQVSSAYHVAKKILEGAHKNTPHKRRKLEESLAWRVSCALDSVEEIE
tara:strand:+ start:446 stop:808 length:363 start_codon:yes stop_codon:yes gene_type:complete